MCVRGRAYLAQPQEVDIGGLVRQQHDQSFASAPHPGSSSHPVHKGGGVLGRVILHNVLHVWDIKAPSCHISAQEAACSQVEN